MTTAAIVASVWAALSGLALMFVRGATAKPSCPPQRGGGVNRCDECGRFCAWNDLRLEGPFYSMDLHGNVSESSYFVCSRHIRVYRDGRCEVWTRPNRARGRGPVKVGEE